MAMVGGRSCRAGARYDAIRTPADLMPDKAWAVDGAVQTVDGEPLSGAQVVLCLPAPNSLSYKTLDITLRKDRLRNPLEEVVTDSDTKGKFIVYPPPGTPYYLVALHPDGFGLVRSDDFAKSHRVKLQPWAKVTGRVKADHRFEQSADITATVPATNGWPELALHQYTVDLGPPAKDGHFEFTCVPPSIKGQLSRSIKGEKGTSYGLPVKQFKLAPGETLSADIDPPSDTELKRMDLLLHKQQPR